MSANTTNKRTSSSTPESGAYLVCDGATVGCNAGSVPYVPLSLNSQSKAYVQDKLAATVKDVQLSSKPFATCKLNPDKYGGQPCLYCPGQWKQLTVDKHPTVSNILLLTENASMICPSFPGKLSIVTHGQSVSVSNNDVKEVDAGIASHMNSMFEGIDLPVALTEDEIEKLTDTMVDRIKIGDGKYVSDNSKKKDVYLRLNEVVDISADNRPTKGDERSVSWQVWEHIDALKIDDERSKIYEYVGTKLTIRFKQVGSYAIEAFGKVKGRESLYPTCILNFHIIEKNEISSITLDKHQNIYKPSDEIKVVKGVQYKATINALTDFNQEELDAMIVSILDSDENLLPNKHIEQKNNSVVVYFPNVAKYTLVIQSHNKIVSFPILCVDNELMSVTSTTGEIARLEETVAFDVKLKEELGSDVDRINWVIKNPNGTISCPQPTIIRTKLVYTFKQKGVYKIGATLKEVKATEEVSSAIDSVLGEASSKNSNRFTRSLLKGVKKLLGGVVNSKSGGEFDEICTNAYTLTVKENEIVGITCNDAEKEITVAVGSSLILKAQTFFKNYKLQDGRIYWQIVDKSKEQQHELEGMDTIKTHGKGIAADDNKEITERIGEFFGKVDDWTFAMFKDQFRLSINKTGTYEVRAAMRDRGLLNIASTQTFKINVQQAEVLRWCFTDSKGDYSREIGWRQDFYLDLQIKGLENQDLKLKLYLHSQNTFGYTSNKYTHLKSEELSELIFAFSSTGKCRIKIDAKSTTWDTLDGIVNQYGAFDKIVGLCFSICPTSTKTLFSNAIEFSDAEMDEGKKEYIPGFSTFPIKLFGKDKLEKETENKLRLVNKTKVIGYFGNGSSEVLKKIIQYGDAAEIIIKIFYSREDSQNKEKFNNHYFVRLIENRRGDEDFGVDSYYSKNSGLNLVSASTGGLLVPSFDSEGIHSFKLITNTKLFAETNHAEFGYADHIPRCFYFIIFEEKDIIADKKEGNTTKVKGSSIYVYPENYNVGKGNDIYLIGDMQENVTKDVVISNSELPSKFSQKNVINEECWLIKLSDQVIGKEDVNAIREKSNAQKLEEAFKNEPQKRLNYFLQLKIAKSTELNKSFAETAPVKIGEAIGSEDGDRGECVCEERIRAFMRMLRVGEGTPGESGYTKMFGTHTFSDMSKHPETVNKGSSAAGAYQIMGYNWKWLKGYKLKKEGDYYVTTNIYEEFHDYVKRYSIPDYSQKSQDKLCLIILKHKRNGIIPIIQKGEIEKAIHDYGCKEWASLPNKDNVSEHTYQGKSQPITKLKKCLSEYSRFYQEELQNTSDLHINKGFLSEFKMFCRCEDSVGKIRYQSPMNSPVLTSPFNPSRIDPVDKKTIRAHKGNDLVSSDTRILAPCDGYIEDVRVITGGGNTIYMLDDDNYTHVFMHLKNNSILVSKGQFVEKGTHMATMGSTGRGTGPHLHYETRINGTAIDSREVNDGLKNELTK